MEKEEFYRQRREKAEAMSICEVARNYGYELKRVATNEYKIKGMGGLTLNEAKNNFFWHSQNKGGGVIQFVELTQNLSYGEAIKALLGSDFKDLVQPKSFNKKKDIPIEKKPFILPEKVEGRYKRLYAYLLQTRCIDKAILNAYVKDKLIYENDKHSIVFVGKDKYGNAKNASWRSTHQNAKERGCIAGSDKSVPFSKKGTSATVFIFEAPIDMISFQSLNYKKNQKKHDYYNLKDHYISLDGVMAKGLDGYLKENPGIKTLVFCLDNDEAGRNAIENYSKLYQDKGFNTFSVKLPDNVKDWNEYLVMKSQSNEPVHEKSSLGIELE